jgi:hypothetical protein
MKFENSETALKVKDSISAGLTIPFNGEELTA